MADIFEVIPSFRQLTTMFCQEHVRLRQVHVSLNAQQLSKVSKALGKIFSAYITDN